MLLNKPQLLGWRIAATLTVAWAIVMGEGSQVVFGQVSARRCASMLNATRKSFDAVRQLDVLITIDGSQTGEGFSRNQRAAYRIAWDRDKQKLSAIQFQEFQGTDSRILKSAFVLADGVCHSTDFESPSAEIRGLDAERLLKDNSIVNPFLAGTPSAGASSFHEVNVDRIWQDLTSQIATQGRVQIENSKIVAKLSRTDGQLTFTTSYQFDALTSLPLRITTVQLNGELPEESEVTTDQLVEWCEPSPGIYLPEAFRIEQGRQLVQTASGKNIQISGSTNYDVNWLSVNHDPPPNMWKKSDVLNYERAKQLCRFKSSIRGNR